MRVLLTWKQKTEKPVKSAKNTTSTQLRKQNNWHKNKNLPQRKKEKQANTPVNEWTNNKQIKQTNEENKQKKVYANHKHATEQRKKMDQQNTNLLLNLREPSDGKHFNVIHLIWLIFILSCTALSTFLFFLSFWFVVPLAKEADKAEENIPLNEKPADDNQNIESPTTEVTPKSPTNEEESKLVGNAWPNPACEPTCMAYFE